MPNAIIPASKLKSSISSDKPKRGYTRRAVAKALEAPVNAADAAKRDLAVLASSSFKIVKSIDVEASVTRMLDNNILDLENLRAEVERQGSKDVDDVRNVRKLPLLSGIEEPISYWGLLDLIQHMKDGLARRRVLKEAEDAAA